MGLDGSEGQAGGFRNLAVGQAIDQRHLQHAPFVVTQSAHHDADAFRFLLKLDGVRSYPRAHRRLVVDRRCIDGPAPLAMPVDQPPLGDRRDEGRFRSHLRIKTSGTAPDFQERLLNGILGIGVPGIRMFTPAARFGLHYYPGGLRRYVARLLRFPDIHGDVSAADAADSGTGRRCLAIGTYVRAQ